ncbi:hypothetical protein [Kordia sp.]|uniref:hypothetical protein n=1 Tax=Kordia sp. TaxID=1965332 RepID=UPI003D285676
MKKKEIKGLSLNKKSISNFNKELISGGTGQSVNATCTGWESCANCTAADCQTGPWESIQFCWDTRGISCENQK